MCSYLLWALTSPFIAKKEQVQVKKMLLLTMLACWVMPSTVGMKVNHFSPGHSCGGAMEIQTVRSSGDVIDGAACQLTIYDDKTDVIPVRVQTTSDGE